MPCPSTGPNCYGHFICLVIFKLNFFGLIFYNSNLFKMIWTCPIRLVLDQNNLDVPNNFGLIEGQGISAHLPKYGLYIRNSNSCPFTKLPYTLPKILKLGWSIWCRFIFSILTVAQDDFDGLLLDLRSIKLAANSLKRWCWFRCRSSIWLPPYWI